MDRKPDAHKPGKINLTYACFFQSQNVGSALPILSCPIFLNRHTLAKPIGPVSDEGRLFSGSVRPPRTVRPFESNHRRACESIFYLCRCLRNSLISGLRISPLFFETVFVILSPRNQQILQPHSSAKGYSYILMDVSFNFIFTASIGALLTGIASS